MSRGWIIGIVCLAISGSSISNCLAQDGRPNKSGSLSFTQRLAALRKTFKREKPSTGNPRNTSQANRQVAYTQAPRSTSQAPRSTPSSKRPSASVQANREAFAARFRRKVASSGSPTRKQNNGAATRLESKKRVGSASSETPVVPTGRYPSAVEGANDIEAALTDILAQGETQETKNIRAAASEETSPTTERKTTKRKTTKSRRTTKGKPTRRSKTVHRGTLDVHEALVGTDNGEDSAAEVVEETISAPKPGTEEAEESNDSLAPAVERKVVREKPKARPTTNKQQLATVEESPHASAEQTPVAEASQPVASYRQPERYRETPQPRQPELRLKTEQPVETKPLLENKQPSAADSVVDSVVDPFDSTTEQSFSGNPMRGSSQAPSFSQAEQSATVEQRAPIQQFGQLRGEVLLSSQQPVIVSHVEGPRRILVGHEATYQIVLENTSDNNAKSIDASIRIPEWADIIDVTSTGGAVERSGEGDNGGVFQWQLQELAARSSAALRVRLVPRSGRPMQLGVQWSQAPVTSETMVEVQEPKLEVGLSGPQEVLFGQPQRYRMVLRNPGTGVAEQVVVQLIPPGGDEESATTQNIGPLQPGEVREIELELTAREAGELIMQATANAEGGLSAEAVKNVLCRKPELQVDWRGPDTKYAGTVSAYYIRVQNPGTAVTEPVTVTFELPEGSQLVSASEGHSIDEGSRTISWRLAGLGVEEAQFMQVRCRVDQPGISQFNVTAQIDSGELSDTKTIETNIVALADLKLDVTDPQGPLPLGDSALYEIRVRNRGKTAAEGINIVGLFSSGIDPVSVEGAQYTERDGRVIFHPIKSLPAGKEIVLRIRAKAVQAGTHIFRAEVSCQDLDIKLAAEETTRFFKDAARWEDGRWDDSRTPYAAENDETVNR